MTTDNLRFCTLEGSLVGMSYWMPTQPFDYDWGLRIGCNNICCSSCRQSDTDRIRSSVQVWLHRGQRQYC